MRKKFALQKRKDIIKFGAKFIAEIIYKNGFSASVNYCGISICCYGKDKLETYNVILKTLKEVQNDER